MPDLSDVGPPAKGPGQLYWQLHEYNQVKTNQVYQRGFPRRLLRQSALE